MSSLGLGCLQPKTPHTLQSRVSGGPFWAPSPARGAGSRAAGVGEGRTCLPRTVGQGQVPGLGVAWAQAGSQGGRRPRVGRKQPPRWVSALTGRTSPSPRQVFPGLPPGCSSPGSGALIPQQPLCPELVRTTSRHLGSEPKGHHKPWSMPLSTVSFSRATGLFCIRTDLIH